MTAHPASPRMQRRTRAFTLMELLLALGVAALLLTYASFHIVSLSTIWEHRADEDFFAEHADGVTHYVTVLFDSASAPKAPSFKEGGANGGNGRQDGDDQDGNGQEEEGQDEERGDDAGNDDSDGASRAVEANGVNLARPPGSFSQADPFIHVSLPDGSAFLSDGEMAGLPGIEAFLRFEERRGLAVVWYCPMRIEDEEPEEEDLRSSLLSPYVSKIEYIYRDPDSNNWETYDELHEERGEPQMPLFLKLTFTHDDEELVRMIRIPPVAPDIPPF